MAIVSILQPGLKEYLDSLEWDKMSRFGNMCWHFSSHTMKSIIASASLEVDTQPFDDLVDKLDIFGLWTSRFLMEIVEVAMDDGQPNTGLVLLDKESEVVAETGFERWLAGHFPDYLVKEGLTEAAAGYIATTSDFTAPAKTKPHNLMVCEVTPLYPISDSGINSSQVWAEAVAVYHRSNNGPRLPENRRRPWSAEVQIQAFLNDTLLNLT